MTARRLAAFILLALIGPSLSGLRAYYHFVHHPSDNATTRIVEKLDLTDLTDQSVYFFVSRTAPRTAANDSYEALISQIRQALNVWDAVPTSLNVYCEWRCSPPIVRLLKASRKKWHLLSPAVPRE